MKRSSRFVGRGTLAALSASSAIAAMAQPVPATDSGEVIIVRGTRPVPGIRSESELDANGIAAFGADNVSDLLDALAVNLDRDGEGPVILINGELSSGVDEIGDLPSEVVSKIQLLSRETAAAIGQRPTRRVVNIVIKPDHRQVTAKVEGRLATAGHGWRGEGEINLLKLHNRNRRSLVVRMVDIDGLLESDRGVLTDLGRPYDPRGNILAYPLPGSEIDSALSALAGQVVTVGGVPVGTPTLAGFAALAGKPYRDRLGDYRSLIPNERAISANGNITERVGQTSLAVNLKADLGESNSLIGVTTATLRVPTGTPFSPFASDVTLATAIGPSLRQESRRSSIVAAATANGPLGTWRYSLKGQLGWRRATLRSDRSADTDALQAGIIAGTIDPFGPLDPALLTSTDRDHSTNRAVDSGLMASANGKLFSLPAGDVRLAARTDWRGLRTTIETEGASPLDRTVNRNDFAAQLTGQIPLFTSARAGALGLELSGGFRKVSRSGTGSDHGAALNWVANSRLSMRGAINIERIPPPGDVLSAPVVTIDSARTFDFVRQETMLVTLIAGGNPDLDAERRRTTNFGGSWRPFDTLDLSLSTDFTDVSGRDVFGALPPVSADVQNAFPGRFVRDSLGRLLQVDTRPVGFDRVRRRELRSSLVFSRSLGGGAPKTGPAQDGDSEERTLNVPGWRLTAVANHVWTLKSDRQASAGLPVIDLLDGGAIGYGGGQARHQLNFGLGLLHRGVGLNLDGDYLGLSRVAAGTLADPETYRFSSRLLMNARLFANLGPLFPEAAVAKGARVSVGVQNLFDDWVRVTDSAGNEPVGYQRYLLDPLGRTITFSLRKVL